MSKYEYLDILELEIMRADCILILLRLSIYKLCRSMTVSSLLTMPPTSKKFRGHIAFGLSVSPSISHALGMSHN